MYGRTKLWLASLEGQDKVVESCIKAHFTDIDQPRKAFFECKTSLSVDVIRAVTTQTSFECDVTPLWLACCEGHPNVVKSLVDAGANLLFCGFRKKDCLHVAAYNGHAKVVKILTGRLDRSSLNRFDEFRTTAAFAAAYNGHADVLKELIQKGAALEMADEDGLTPLWIATYRGHVEVVRALLDANVNVDSMSHLGFSPLYIAAGQGYLEIVNLLIYKGADVRLRTKTERRGPLYIAAAHGFTMVAARLLSAGADLEVKDIRGATPLCIAVENGEVGVVKCLLQAGADITVWKNDGYSVLRSAGYCGHTEACNLLLQASKGKVPNDRMQLEYAFRDAAYNGHKDTVSLFLGYGVDTEAKPGGRTALFDASFRGHADVVEVLIAAKANVNTKNEKGMSAGEAAMTHGHLDVVDLLVKAGWDITKEPGTLHKAVKGNHEELIRHLVTSATDLSTWNFPDMFATATVKGHIGLIQILFKTGMEVCPKKMLQLRVCTSLSPEAYRMVMITLRKYIKNLEPVKQISILFSDVVDYQTIFNGFTLHECKLNDVPDILGLTGLDLDQVVKTPGLGNVMSIPRNRATEVFDYVREKMDVMTRMFNKHHVFNVTLRKVGSAEEGTSVGLPDEADFLFESNLVSDREVSLWLVKDGYVRLEKNPDYKSHVSLNGERLDLFCNGSKRYHDEFWGHLAVSGAYEHIKASGMLTMTKDGGQASTPISVKWTEPVTSRVFPVSVDLVPVVRFRGMVDGQRVESFMMKTDDFTKAGFSVVAKPPHKNSDLGKSLCESDRIRLWRVSFANLEAAHFSDLDANVKNAYVAAKILRNPDVCRVFLRDNDGILRTVDKYITSYMLKTVFLYRVTEFKQNNTSLLNMVAVIYTDLAKYLSRGNLPLYWMKNYNVLAGLGIDIKASCKVAVLMTSLLEMLSSCERQSTDSPPTGYFTFDLES